MVSVTWLLLFLTPGFVSVKSLEMQINKEKTLTSLEKIFDFALAEPAFNIDGVFGFAWSEGLLMNGITKTKDLASLKRLIRMKDKLVKIRETIVPTLNVSEHRYEMFINYLLNPDLWSRNINFRKGDLNPDVIHGVPTQFDLNTTLGFHRYIYYSTFSEPISDSCIVKVLENTKHLLKKMCQISNKCYEYMVSHDFDSRDTGYGATHRLLFLQIARMRNCMLNKKMYFKLATKLCSYILWEAKKLVKLNVPETDLLIEQMVICGYEGFSEFMNDDWIDLILKTQHSSGCFYPSLKTRQKREATVIKYGCSDHTTGLAANLLATYYLYLLEREQH